MRHRVVAGRELRAAQRDGDEVGALAGLRSSRCARRGRARARRRASRRAARHAPASPRASRATALASSAAVRISSSRSRRLLLAAPSVPRHRFTPARCAALRPARSRSPASGWTTGNARPSSRGCASSWISSSCRWTACTAIRLGPSRPSRRSRSSGRTPCSASERSISSLGLVHVHVHRQVELGGERRDLAEASRRTPYRARAARGRTKPAAPRAWRSRSSKPLRR